MSWASELPPELLCRPTGLVVLTGLDLIYNAVHKAIWDSFCNNRRADRVPLQFLPLAADHEYAKCRPKRTSYEWYIPKGILKTSWMKKHLDQIPAVVVILFDLDWDDPLWKERQMECSTLVEIVRNSLQGRGTKVCVVLVQKNAPLPPGEDVVAGERAASLCSACELSAKSLFVLPLTDHLLGYTIRLENAFYELAQTYYHNEARKVKGHRDFLNKTTHQLLFVRHQFKIAFFNELKQDSHTALKHYKQAYVHILELRMLDTSLLETKTIAGFISYKICRLSFQHNAPLDAITQFRKHIDFFKGKVGMPDLAFEHSAWMARQFQSFGDLFDDAIKLGLTAIQTQHPGIYFQQAAYQSISRKQLCLALCHAPPGNPSIQTDALDHLSKLDYYGQRPWRQGQLSIEPPDAVKEKEGILALQMLELKVDHLWIIIPLLGQAVTQFKKYKSPRMKRYLMVQMGEEYYHAGDYTKALTLLSRVTWDYRQERWWTLLTSVLTTQLRCAYLVGNIQEYVTVCLELIGKYTTISADDKTRIQMNLIRVMSGDVAEPEPGCLQASTEAALTLWKNLSSKPEPVIVNIDMSNIVPFVECKAQFSKDSYTADECIHIIVYLRSCALFPIRFSKLSVQISNQIYNKFCILADDMSSPGKQQADLFLNSDKVKVHQFSFCPVADDVYKGLEIMSVVLELSACSSRSAVLHWAGGGGDAVAEPPARRTFKPLADLTKNGELQWDQIQVNSFTRVVSRLANVDILVTHLAPALLNESYKFTIDLINNEKVSISSVQVLFGLRDADESAVRQSTNVYKSTADQSPVTATTDSSVVHKVSTDLGEMQPLQKICLEMFTVSATAGNLTAQVSVSYDIKVMAANSGVGDKKSDELITCRCYKEQLVTLDVISPLAIELKLVSLKFESLEVVANDQPFLLMADVKSESPHPITLDSSLIQLSSGVRFTDEVIQCQLSQVSLQCDDCAGECTSLVLDHTISPANPTTLSLGSYVVKFKRANASNDSPLITYSTILPSVAIKHIPIYVDVDIAACGSVQSSLPVTYHIYNKTHRVQDVEVLLESSDAFMFAGLRQVRVRVLPLGQHQLHYNLVPLIPGNVRLPVMHLSLTRFPDDAVDAFIQKLLPSEIFIQPRNRSSAFVQPGIGKI